MRKTSISQLRLLQERFFSVRKPDELAKALGVTPQRLTAQATQPNYSVFSTEKRDGSMRLIEDPVPPLKVLQRALNGMLQAVYYFEKPESAYGFVVNPVDDPMPRHILSHAERHVSARWLLNIDLEDFFHQISTEKIIAAVQAPPFQCDEATAALIAGLCTWKGRLPMGAPTSPALSNIAFREPDKLLTFRSRARGWLYTRYADDLTFSSAAEAMTPADLIDTVAFIEAELGYTVHPEKRVYSGEGDPKIVTRLVLSGGAVNLPDRFYTELNTTMSDLQAAGRIQHKMGVRHTRWLSDYSQKVEGMLGFAKHILGDRDIQYLALLQQYQDATTHRAEDFGAYSWLDFPYM